MGGSSSSSSSSSTTQSKYTPTKSVNPYTSVYTDNNGTQASFKDGTLYKNIYDYGNSQNVNQWLNDLRNPNLDSTTNQAKIKAYNKEVNSNTRTALENDIINPLSQRNMIRSSQATNMYNNLSNSLADNYDNFITNLLAESQNENVNLINNLMNWYAQGQNVLNQDVQNNINQAGGHAIQTTNSNGTGAAA